VTRTAYGLTATMASRGVLFRPFESDEISEFSTLGAKGEDSFWGIYALIALPEF